MEANKKIDDEIENYRFLNFTTLEKEELDNIRLWRNDPSIRKVMYSTEEITPEQHKKFIQSLSSSDDRYYWLVLRDNIPIGVLSIINVEKEERSGQLGYYLLPNFLESGLGMEFISKSILFLITKIGILKIFGRTEISNSNALAINYHLGFQFRPEMVTINGMLFIEQDLLASDFIERYEKIKDTKELIKSVKKFNQIYKNYKS